MSRLQRLYGIVEYLRVRREPITAPELAERFGVGERTIYRDIAELRDQEVPIHGEPGRGGGISLGAEYSMPPLGLSLNELFGLWVSYRLTKVANAVPPGSTISPAFEKVLASLPRSRRERLQKVLSRVVMAKAPPQKALATAGPIDGGVYTACEQAFLNGFGLRISYIDINGNQTERLIAAHGLLVQAPLWYLLAFDQLRNAPRMFRLDRIIEARVDETTKFDPGDPRPLFKELMDLNFEIKD